MKRLNILFVCKYNRFRSRVAESYFNQLNKDKTINVISGGIIVGRFPLNEREVNITKKYGVAIEGPPKPIRFEELVRQDLIIIVADNVPKEIFKSKRFDKRVIVWSIPDVYPNEKKSNLRKRVANIKKKVQELIKNLERQKWKLT